jgi:hypothetical protein
MRRERRHRARGCRRCRSAWRWGRWQDKVKRKKERGGERENGRKTIEIHEKIK